MAQLIPNYTGGVQGANSAVLPDNNLALQTYLGLAEKNYRNKLFEYDKAKDEAKKIAEATDFNTAEMMSIDVQPTLDDISKLKELAKEHPEQVDEPNSDFDQLYKRINFKINKSKYQQSELKYHKTTGADRYKDNPELLYNTLHDFENNPDIDKRELVLPIPPPDFNIFDLNDQIVKGVVSTNPDKIKSVNDGHGNRIYEIPQDVDKTEIAQKVEMKWLSDRNKATQMFNSFSDEEKAKYNNDPHEWYVQAKTASLPIDDKSKIEIRSIPQETQGANSREQTTIKFIAEKAHDLENPQSDIYTGATVTMNDGKKKSASETDTFTGQTVVVKDGSGKQYKTTIDKIYNIDGKLYAAPSKLRSETGSVAIKDLIPITNIEDQIIVPYVNTEYGSSPNTAKLADNTLDYYRSLKGGKSSEPTTESGIKWK